MAEDNRNEVQNQNAHKGAPLGLDKVIERFESHRDRVADRKEAGDLRGQKIRSGSEKLLTRVLSGVVYAVIVVGCVFAGQWSTAFLVAAMAWLCCSEFFRMARLSGRMPNEILGLALAVLFPLMARLQGLPLMLIGVFLLLILCGGWYVVTPRASISDVAITFFGPIYTSLSFSALVLIRMQGTRVEGAIFTLLVMLSVWANDTLAYFVGSRFGKHKLAPRISPNKTLEGFWGGIAGSVAVWLCMAIFHVGGVTYPIALVAGPLVGVASVAGDLFESRIKRGVGVKDSGNIMPGHGGLLDRSDAMLFGCMVAYLVMHVGGIL